MANSIKVATKDAILGLLGQGWSERRVARELGVNRRTVRRHARLARGQSAPNPTPVQPGPQSACEPFREVVLAKLETGLTAQRIWQDLAGEHGFTAGYQSVKRFCKRLGAKRALPFRRIEVEPGAEGQVDLGQGGRVRNGGSRRRRPHVLRIVLGFSRRAYSEGIWRQTTDEFLGALENSFWYFGGVPRTVVIDNLKAAVAKADWFDPELNPKIEAFARHYGCVVLPTKPFMPRHKGKVESGIGYVQGNALNNRDFDDLAGHNAYLLEWETTVADVRVHGTTKRRPIDLFEEFERGALLPLPPERFPCFHEGERTVHRDGHVEVERAYYSVPPEYLGRRVWVRWDTRLVRVLSQRFEEIAVHARKRPGAFSTNPGHVPPEKISEIERGATHLLKRAALMGDHAGRWAEAVVRSRGIQGMRTVQGLLSLARRRTPGKIDRACKIALGFDGLRLKDVKALVESDRSDEQVQFEFMSEHPIIRNMNEYGRIVQVSFVGGEAEIVPISAAPRAGPPSGAAGGGGGLFQCKEGGMP